MEVTMKVKDVFEDIFTGFNINSLTTDNKFAKFYNTLQKDSIQYTNIIESKLIEKKIGTDIKKKYLMQPRDILIFVKPPYRVGTYSKTNDLNLIIPNNFIVLRGINMDLYSYIFVTNYLENYGIEKYVKENNITGNLSKVDIEKIDLPDIPKEKQMTISPLLNAINERSATYSTILQNDEQIIKYAISKVTGDKDD